MVFWIAFDLDATLGSFDSIMPYLGFFFPESYQQIFKAPHWRGEKFPTIVPSPAVKQKLRRAFSEFVKIMAEYEPRIKMLRPGIIPILQSLLAARAAGKIGGMMIYSNNSNPYCLHYAHELLKRLLNTNDDIFCPLVHWWHPLRNSEVRQGYDPPLELGYGPKRYETIVAAFEKEVRCGYYTPAIRHETIVPEHVIFLDDQIHPGIKAALPPSNYIQVQPYGSKVKVDFIIDAFLRSFESQKLDYNTDYITQFSAVGMNLSSGDAVVKSLKDAFVTAETQTVNDSEAIHERIMSIINRTSTLGPLKNKIQRGLTVSGLSQGVTTTKVKGGSGKRSTRRVRKGKGLKMYIQL